MGVTVQKATQLYGILAAGGKLNKEEKAELDEYAARFKSKEDVNAEELLKDL